MAKIGKISYLALSLLYLYNNPAIEQSSAYPAGIRYHFKFLCQRGDVQLSNSEDDRKLILGPECLWVTPEAEIEP